MEKIEQIENTLIATLMASINEIAYRMRMDEISSIGYSKLDSNIEDAIERVRHLTGSMGNPDPLYRSAGVTIDSDKKELLWLATQNVWEEGTNSRLNVAIAMFLVHAYGYLTTFEKEWHLAELKGYFFHIISESPMQTEEEKNKYRIEFVSHIQKHFEEAGKINGLPVNPDRVYFELSQFDLNDWQSANGGNGESAIHYDDWMKHKNQVIKEIKEKTSSNFMDEVTSNFIAEVFYRIEEKIKKESS